MEKIKNKEKYNVYDLVELVAYLRSADGCPWDREQTHKTITRNLLEEAYEAVEAIENEDAAHMQEELGDVLLQVVFHTQIERELGSFNIDDVADMVVRKLVGRHPHVFGDLTVANSTDVISNWDRIKQKERGDLTLRDVLSGISASLPALWRAEKMLRKIDNSERDLERDLLSKLDNTSSEAEIIGAELITLVNKSVKAGVDPELALHKACDLIITNVS